MRSRAGCAAAFLLLGILAGCGNKSTTPTDTIPPGKVNDLRLTSVTDSTVAVAWTAPGDDGTVGTATQYDFRYEDSPLSEQDWSSGIPIPSPPAPQPAGTTQSFVIHVLPRLQKSYLAMRTRDEASNWSVLSDQISATPGPPLCAVTPDTLDFGRTPVGSSFVLSFTVTNEGGGTISDQVGGGCTPEFTVLSGGGSFGLLGGQSQKVTVRFSPQADGDESCLIPLQGPCASVLCLGTGVEAQGAFVPIDVGAGANFVMGSPRNEPGRSDDETQHTARLTRSILVSDHELTQSEWLSQMSWNESTFPAADRPVENVTWFDAIAYCNARSAAEHLSLAYNVGNVTKAGNHIVAADVIWRPDSTGYRLLTEAEWEYICRAGSQTAFSDGAIKDTLCVPIDPNLDAAGWFCGNSGNVTHPVRGKEQNAWGFYDAHGNVSEWCWDWYASYPDSSGVIADYSGPLSGGSRVVRGGSCNSAAGECRSAYRLYHPPGNFYPSDDPNGLGVVGFRLARNAP